MRTRSYSELSKLKNYEDRFNYLKLDGDIGIETFGSDRYMNQLFYKSKEWKDVKRQVILRDSDGNDCLDLGHKDYPINGRVVIHHMNPLRVKDMSDVSKLLDPEYLVAVSIDTHNALHYGTNTKDFINGKKVVDRKQNDTCPWK